MHLEFFATFMVVTLSLCRKEHWPGKNNSYSSQQLGAGARSRMGSHTLQIRQTGNEVSRIPKTHQIWVGSRPLVCPKDLRRSPLGICEEMVTEWVTALQADWIASLCINKAKQAGESWRAPSDPGHQTLGQLHDRSEVKSFGKWG